jgi:hypothetical protein
VKDLAREGFEWICSDPGRSCVLGIKPISCEGDDFLRRTESSVWGTEWREVEDDMFRHGVL